MKHNPFVTNGLSIAFGLLFLLSLAGQAFSGVAYFNEGQVASGLEYLQFLLFIVLTVWLVQKGSPESKEIEKRGVQSDEEELIGEFSKKESPKWAKAGGFRTAIFSTSLGLVMGTVFVLSWLVQSVTGFSAFAEQQLGSLQDPGTWAEYVVSAEFWNRTLQNWQSEFLAVWSMVILSVYLRQRSSPESKPVGEAHDTTGASN
jgi:hypothetical protein